MTPEQQRTAIAKWMGWQKHSTPEVSELWYRKGVPFVLKRDLPDYLRDLNAMHEAEAKLLEGYDISDPYNSLPDQWEAYVYWLAHLTPLGFQDHATAPQRAEALLRALDLWTDDKEPAP